MPQIINTNIASLNAQRNLDRSQSAGDVALQRLSSGLRINSAKDDAAGLAISTRFDSQVTGLNMARRNANDGISLAQTAEGAMEEITRSLQRIRELAVQSANATNSISDRQALNQEVQQRVEEINRIATQTSFNGLKVLDGTFGTQTFQVGANTGETIGVSGLDSRGSQLGSVITRANDFSSIEVEDPDGNTLTIRELLAQGFTADFEVTLTPTNGGAPLVLNVSDASSLGDILSPINAATGETGVRAFFDAANNDLIFASQFGTAFDVEITSTVAGWPGDITLDSATDGATLSLNQVDISTREGADLAMIAVDYAIDTINSFRAELGAVQNRFESTIANLQTTAENLSASNSRIRDADFAAESAELARTQVLQQAGLSVLAQANARPQQVLQLLQG
ncbi:MAG: flagellin [Marinobacter sp.]|nr:flagellin [Marinobacter sp.]